MSDPIEHIEIPDFDENGMFPFFRDPQMYCPACGVRGSVWTSAVADIDIAICIACDGYVSAYIFDYRSDPGAPGSREMAEEVARLKEFLAKRGKP